MKKLLLAGLLLVSSFGFIAAAQDATDKARLSAILTDYYHIKDALVASNSKTAAEAATAFIKDLNGISYKLIAEGNVHTLLKDAGAIADATDISKQRVVFASFSSNMASLARGLDLTDKPVYVQYCPMKKASWLSSEKPIKNPYYGNAMLTCGSLKETIE